jgi:hypothetical protein
VAEKTGNGDSWQPVTGADPARIRELGALLRLRRAALGYRHVPAFVRDRRINTRMVGDIEHGRRDTFTYPSLTDAARAYDVTYESMMDVVWSGAGELAPAPAAPPPGEDTPPMTAERAAADRPWYDEINERRFALAARGIIDPSGAQMFPDAPDDAKAWDGIGARMPVGDRVWFIADLRRWAAGRVPNSDTGVTGA